MSHQDLLHAVQKTLPATVAVVAPRPEQLASGRLPAGGLPPCGAGVIVDADGIIITNNHVVEGADPNHLEVITYDGKRHKATLVGRSPTADVAVLKIVPYSGMVVAPLGDSDTVQAGQVVFAIGTPRGLVFSASAGIVSYPNRFQRGLDDDDDDDDDSNSPSVLPSIQHDAACNPGNSGGGLFDIDGNLIGINTFILTAPVVDQHGRAVASALGSIGLGMALQVNAVKAVADKIRQVGGAQAGGLPTFRLMRGARVDRVTLTPPPAVLTAVTEAARRLGLKRGDTLLSVNGIAVQHAWHAEALLVAFAGEEVVLAVRGRNGDLRNATITLPQLTVLDTLAPVEEKVRRERLGYMERATNRRK